MYVDEHGVERFTQAESSYMLIGWRSQAKKLETQILDYATDAENRGWPEFALEFLNLAAELNSTPLNELYYKHIQMEHPRRHDAFFEEFLVLNQRWFTARRAAGVSFL